MSNLIINPYRFATGFTNASSVQLDGTNDYFNNILCFIHFNHLHLIVINVSGGGLK